MNYFNRIKYQLCWITYKSSDSFNLEGLTQLDKLYHPNIESVEREQSFLLQFIFHSIFCNYLTFKMNGNFLELTQDFIAPFHKKVTAERVFHNCHIS